MKSFTSTTTSPILINSIRRSPWRLAFLLSSLTLACFALSPIVRAVSPAPDGGYPGFNTAEGNNALLSLTSGTYNTAIGDIALSSNTTGKENTATGAEALVSNSTGNLNTATGAGALTFNNADDNTATGVQALYSNSTGSDNTATGEQALYNNISGNFNTATGVEALYSNMNGNANTATGLGALFGNTSGGNNTAEGNSALVKNTTGSNNTANGFDALFHNTTGNYNTVVGFNALLNNTIGSLNTALGVSAGSNLTTGSGNVCIGSSVVGVAGESNTTRIRNIYASTATGRAVYVNSDNKIGVLSSSRRYKEEIKPMDKASATLFALRPVTFRYKKEVDSGQALSFGLIAEEVTQVNPELVTLDKEGEPETVRYDAVNAMLLNEFLKEHRKVEQQEATITQMKKDMEATAARQKKQIEALTSGLEKVSTQLEASKAAPQIVASNTQ